MLGFWTVIYAREATSDDKKIFARWEAGLGGLEWVENLVRQGSAKCLQGNGYPNRYEATLGVVLHAIRSKGIIPKNGIWVVGDDYVQAPGFMGEVELFEENINQAAAETVVTIDAWDQS